MNRRQLEYFIAVVDSGSMSRAAESLSVSQPSVSQTIRMLERLVGRQLFERRGSRLTLSSAGEALVVPARRILNDFRAAEVTVSAALAKDEDQLLISAPAVLARHPLSHLVAQMARQHPACRILVLEQVAPNDVWDAVESGDADIGFANAERKSDLQTQRIGVHRIVAVFPPGSELMSPDIELTEVAEHHWITGPPLNYYSRRLLDEAMQRAGLTLQRRILTAHRQHLEDFVMEGLGPTIMIEAEALALAERGAVMRRIVPAIERPYYLLHRQKFLSERARDFVNICTESARP